MLKPYIKLNSKGVGLLEILMVMVISGVILSGITTMTMNAMKTGKTAEVSGQVGDVLHLLRLQLSSDTVCTASLLPYLSTKSFPVATPGSLTLTEIRSADNKQFLKTGETLPSIPSTKLTALKLVDIVNISASTQPGTAFSAEIAMTLDKTNLIGPNAIDRKVPIFLKTTSSGGTATITSCSIMNTVLTAVEKAVIESGMCASLGGTWSGVKCTLPTPPPQLPPNTIGSCATGSALVGLNADGTKVCTPLNTVLSNTNQTDVGKAICNSIGGTWSSGTCTVRPVQLPAASVGSCSSGQALVGLKADGSKICQTIAASPSPNPVPYPVPVPTPIPQPNPPYPYPAPTPYPYPAPVPVPVPVPVPTVPTLQTRMTVPAMSCSTSSGIYPFITQVYLSRGRCGDSSGMNYWISEYNIAISIGTAQATAQQNVVNAINGGFPESQSGLDNLCSDPARYSFRYPASTGPSPVNYCTVRCSASPSDPACVY